MASLSEFSTDKAQMWGHNGSLLTPDFIVPTWISRPIYKPKPGKLLFDAATVCTCGVGEDCRFDRCPLHIDFVREVLGAQLNGAHYG